MKTIILLLLSWVTAMQVFPQVYPPPACIEYTELTLMICPPDSVPSYSGGLLGYSLYADDQYLDFIPAGNPGDTLTYTFEPVPDPGQYDFCAKAVYQNWISDTVCDSGLIYYGRPVPFTEDWSSGSFEVNSWQAEGSHWEISADSGFEAPSAVYHGQSGLTDYAEALTSYVFLGDSFKIGSLYIEFDLKLVSLNPTGEEKLLPQYWDWTDRAWYGNMYVEPSNENGSFEWRHYTMRLNTVTERLFRIRFLAEGANSNDISGWYIDNVHVYRTCMAPIELDARLNEDGMIEMYWITPTCGNPYPFDLSYCSTEPYTSIGTGDSVTFDVAARWTTEMLVEYAGKYIRGISFFPAEENATYSVRIWEGDSANLVYEQVVTDPEIEDWNFVLLDNAHPIDTGEVLWVGYQVEANTGYPAGMDWGPAHDGYSNMMYWQGQWSSLLEINPQLDYNWLIKGHVTWSDPVYCGNRIYRKVNQGEYALIADIPMDMYYLDEQADPSDLNCYLVSDVIAKIGDTCESGYTNESCVAPVGLQENSSGIEILIYPNPAEDILHVESSDLMSKIQVFDLTNRFIFETLCASKSELLDLSLLKNGVYLIRIFTGKGSLVRKIVVI